MLAAAMFVAGVPLCSDASKILMRKDPPSVVRDEMAAFPIVYAFVPLHGNNLWVNLILGFVLFRVFDVWKPPPARQCDKLETGPGVMIDDTVAAIYAAAVLTVFVWMK